jgi:hypothetical protein
MLAEWSQWRRRAIYGEERRSLMGTWGVGLYESDTALDTQHLFHEARGKGMSVDAAVEHVFREMGCEREEEPEMQLVLANELLELGITSHPLFAEARKTIVSGEEIELNWRDNASGEDTRKREAVLQRLLALLPGNGGSGNAGSNHSPQRPPESPRAWWQLCR